MGREKGPGWAKTMEGGDVREGEQEQRDCEGIKWDLRSWGLEESRRQLCRTKTMLAAMGMILPLRNFLVLL